MREGRTDIQADPVLFKACANDVKRHCSDIPFGKGKGKNKIDRTANRLRACLHGGGGSQVGEVTCGWSPHLSCKRDQS